MNANKIEQLSNFCCEKFVFDSNFDSGNLLKVELAKRSTTSIDSVQCSAEQTNITIQSSKERERQIDVEFNLWTRPDSYQGCSGGATSSDNLKKCRNLECNGSCGNLNHGNRTWFFFSIRGGEKNQLIKLNLVNLNKQAKLFSQGMHPVMRQGLNGKWERIKEKPSFQVTEENFILSFCHRTNENVEDNLVFYAFTFPWTYQENIKALESYDKKFKKSLEELDLIVKELNRTCKERIVIDIHQTVNNFSQDSDKERSQFSLTSDDAHDGSFLQDKFENFLLGSKSFGSSVDDNTSDSMQQLSSLVHNVKIEKVPENFTPTVTRTSIEEIKNDIYYHRELVIYSFEQKRVDMLTITSFEGIEEEREERIKSLFPDFSTPRCHTFKNKKIIFISSRVHPGETPASHILNGFINLLFDRKSQIASTLRKLYVFKIIPFLNPDGVFNGLYRSDTLGHNLNRVYLNPKIDRHPTIYAVRKLIRFYHFGCDKPDITGESDQKELIHSDEIDIFSFEEKLSSSENIDIDLLNPNPTPFQRNESFKLIDEMEDTITTSAVNAEIILPSSSNERKHITSKPRSSVGKKLKETAMTVKNLMAQERRSIAKDGLKSANQHNKHMISHYNCEKSTEKLLQSNSQNHQNLNISVEYRIQTDENGDKSIVEEKSNLFLYLDLHGHASKKGVFMYGNHLSNTLEAVEVMLLPKLMSLNCHHFHFDACNFSERNMYLKGRRDGLSKEGSGRVAIFKATGLIKSYTLESNYNVAKCVNILPPKGKDLSCKIHNLIPPKFTPSIFEEVGKALGPSLLDLTNSNPLTRIQNSEFRSLQGLRNALKNEISRGLSRARVNKFAKMTKKRQTSILSTSTSIQDTTTKENENKGSFSSTSLNVSNSSSSSSSQNSQQIVKSQIPSVLKVPSSSKGGKIPTFMKKDGLHQNKKKILRENVTTALLNQIPHKKIRVSNSSNNSNPVSANPEKETSNCYVNDSELPCCSRSTPSFIYQKVPSPTASSSSSSNSNSGIKITNFMPIKKVGVNSLKFKTSMGAKKPRSGLDQNVAVDNSLNAPTFHSISEKLIKKKKRLLKTETTIKRKKSRPQKPLV